MLVTWHSGMLLLARVDDSRKESTWIFLFSKIGCLAVLPEPLGQYLAMLNFPTVCTLTRSYVIICRNHLLTIDSH